MRDISIVLIDDSEQMLEMLAEHLGRQPGFRIAGRFSRPGDALRALDQLDPDVVLVDLLMPEMSGLDTIPRIRALRPRAPVIVLTLMDTQEYRRAAAARGASALLSKSAAVSDLVPLIRTLAGTTPVASG